MVFSNDCTDYKKAKSNSSLLAHVFQTKCSFPLKLTVDGKRETKSKKAKQQSTCKSLNIILYIIWIPHLYIYVQ